MFGRNYMNSLMLQGTNTFFLDIQFRSAYYNLFSSTLLAIVNLKITQLAMQFVNTGERTPGRNKKDAQED